MKLIAAEVAATKRILEQEVKLKLLGKKSPSSLSKKERAVVPKIIEALPSDLSEEEYSLPFNKLTTNVIRKVVETRINVLVNHILPEYDVRKNKGQDVDAYVNKQNAFVLLLKGVVEKCQA